MKTDSKLKIIVCLKTNDQRYINDTYNSRHVYKIQEMLRKYVTIDYEFYCLTNDNTLNCNIIPIENSLFGWWCKLELYKIPGPVLYLDLDTVIINNIDSILEQVQGRTFSPLFFNLNHYNKNLINSGFNNINWLDRVLSSIMYWSGDLSFIWKAVTEVNFFDILTYQRNKNKNTNRTALPHVARGDQELLSFVLDKNNLKNIVTPFARLQKSTEIKSNHVPVYESFPILHYKQVINKLNNQENLSEILSQNKIVWFSDKPRPWEQNIIPY